MAAKRIAVLFDAENINCMTALQALSALAPFGEIQIKRAVGDFSAANLASWLGCGRDNGIELVLQPSLGKGKNGADIRLTIEAMDVAHQGGIDAIALITRDCDFTPLALRLRKAGLLVLGFSQSEPAKSFRAACSSFVVLGAPASAPIVACNPAAAPAFDKREVASLRRICLQTSQQGPVTSVMIAKAIAGAEPDLASRLSGNGKFLKTLVALGVVERVGSGAAQLVQAAQLQSAG